MTGHGTWLRTERSWRITADWTSRKGEGPLLVTEMDSSTRIAGYSSNTTRCSMHVPEVAPRRGSPLRAARSCLNVLPVVADLESYALLAWSTSNCCVLDDASGFVRSEVEDLTSLSALYKNNGNVPDE